MSPSRRKEPKLTERVASSGLGDLTGFSGNDTTEEHMASSSEGVLGGLGTMARD